MQRLIALSIFVWYVALGSGVAANSQTALDFDSIQTAIDACPANSSPSHGSCVIQLACGSYQSPPLASHQIRINDKKNILIKGCGMNGTQITWDIAGAGSMFKVTNSRWITIQDVQLRSIGQFAASSGILFLDHHVLDVTLERVHIHAEAGQFALGIGGSTSYDPVTNVPNVGTVYMTDGRIHTAGGLGLHVIACDDCWFAGNWFGAVVGIPGRASHQALAQKRRGSGVRFVNNTFDFQGDSATTQVVGLDFYRHKPPGGPDIENDSAQSVGNSFTHMTATSVGQRFYGYWNGLVSGNVFKCDTPGSCDTGVAFATNPGVTNRQNLIVDNQFIDFLETAPGCPIFLGGTESDNVIEGNVFRLDAASSSANGVCGNTVGNRVGTNHVF